MLTHALPLALSLGAWTLGGWIQDGLTVDGVPAVDGSELAQVRLEARPSAPYPGQPVELAVYVELEPALAEGSLLQLFRRELDLEIQLRFPGRGGWEPAHPRSGGLRYALDDEVARIASWGDAEPRRSYRATWTRVFGAPGPAVVPGPLLRFAYTTGFRADLLAGSVPTDRVEAYSQAPTLTIQVADFPEEGRPPEFRGDLGRFELEAAPSDEDLCLGEPFRLAVLVRPLDDDPPPIPPFPPAPDLRLLDTHSISQGTARLVTWTAEPLHPGTLRVPAVVLASFDPVMGEYALARTEPVMHEVRDPTGGPQGEAGGGPGAAPKGLLVLGAAALGALGLLWWLRRSAAPNTNEPQVVVTQATAHDQVLGALAARLGCAPAAVARPDLARRLVDAGVDAEAAQRAAELFHALEAERYGGPETPGLSADPAVDLSEVLRELRILG